MQCKGGTNRMVCVTLKIYRAIGVSAPAAAAAFMLSGCMGAPTYGTGTPADEQLLQDITGIIDIAPKKKAEIDYKPRPEIVKPADTATLPPPQQSVAAASSPEWPETPEQMRERLRAEATANRDSPQYRPSVTDSRGQDIASAESDPRNPRLVEPRTTASTSTADTVQTAETPKITSAAAYDRIPGNHEPTPDNAREEFNRRLAEQKQGSPTERRYLSEPPLEYRVPASTAPSNDIGEDEWKKENRQKAEARQKAGKSSWRDWFPWL
jgi:hypothetical protein